MTDKDERADMNDRTAPMPAVAAPSAASPSAMSASEAPPEPAVEPEATQNREPLGDGAPREGSAVYAAPARLSGSFDDEVERNSAPPPRPAVGYTASYAAPTSPASFEGRERPKPISTGPAPAEVFASRASFAGAAEGQEVPPPSVLAPPEGAEQGRPRERMPIGLPVPSESSQPVPPSAARAAPDAPTFAGAIVPAAPPPVVTGDHDDLVITAPMALATLTALRARAVPTEPHVVPAAATTAEEDPPPVDVGAEVPVVPPAQVPTAVPAELPPDGYVEVTAEFPAGVTADVPAPPPGTPTLELPAADNPPPAGPAGATTSPAPLERRRSLAVPVAIGALIVAGLVGGLAVRGLVSSTGDADAAPSPTPVPPAALAPVVTAPAVAAPAVAPLTPPRADPLQAEPPQPIAAHRAPPPQQGEPTPASPTARERPVRAPDGYGPFVDRTGAAAGLAAALSAGVRAVLGDALAGSDVGVRGEVRRARLKDGVAAAECGLVVFDGSGLRATVRGAAAVDAAGAAATVALPRAAEACARGVEAELRAAVAHAQGAR